MKQHKGKPLYYRQWGQIKKEMYKLVLCVAVLLALETVLHYGAQFLVAFYRSKYGF